MKKRRDFERKIRHSSYKRKGLKVVGVRYVSTPDAESKLSRAIDILLGAAAREPEGSTNDQKEEGSPQDSQPEGGAGQSDGEKG